MITVAWIRTHWRIYYTNVVVKFVFTFNGAEYPIKFKFLDVWFGYARVEAAPEVDGAANCALLPTRVLDSQYDVKVVTNQHFLVVPLELYILVWNDFNLETIQNLQQNPGIK